MKRVKHNNNLAKAIATAAEMKNVDYLKREAVKLAKELNVKLPEK